MVLSPYWFRMARVLYEQMPANAFGFSPGFKRYGVDYNRLVSPRHHFFCDCFTAEKWALVNDTFEDFYQRFIADRDYYDRDDDGIRAWHKGHGQNEYVTSQDGARLTAIKAAGLKRYQMEVNRAYYVGEKGIHFTPELYTQGNFKMQTPFIFNEDATREGFVWDD